jgi:DNA-binding GntR family transcriptional regulator
MQRRGVPESGGSGNELGVTRILRVRLVDTVTSQVRNMILAGKLGPGTRLRQVDLSSRMGISRTPLREALMKLEQEGLITVLPRGGLRVLELDAAGAVELYELREVLDGLAARLAAQRIDRAGLRALRGHLRGMQAAVPRRNAHSWFLNHAAFHEQIFRSSGNGRALALVSQVRLSIQRFHQLLLKTPNRLEVALQEHLEIFRAIEGGRAEAAESAARRHIKNAREIVLHVLREREQATAAQGG